MVDDNRMGLAARKAVFEELHYHVTIVSTPEDALARARQNNFDVIVTDFKMGAMNGVDLIKALRENNISTPVILLSGFVDALGLDEANTGADLVIQKSSNEVSHLIRGVKTLLKRNALSKKPVKRQSASARTRRKQA
jgi:CheY-like chemotaxis protein